MAVFNQLGIKSKVKNVAAAGTAEQGPDLPVLPGFSLLVKAKGGNTGTMFVGGTKAEAQSATEKVSIPIGTALGFDVVNANVLWFDAAVSGEGVECVVESDKRQ
jgi:hypothetical protein